ncbi:hypothetical protein DOE73_10695 [Paenibacillus dendritiformis]|nr:hypothetical protein DOE73_10695 [Paenibacillus dendritiformis]
MRDEPERMIPLPVMMGLRMASHLFDNKVRLLALFKDKLWHRKWSVRSWASFLGYVSDERHINDFSLPTLVITGDKDGMLPLDYTKDVFCNRREERQARRWMPPANGTVGIRLPEPLNWQGRSARKPLVLRL